MCRLLKALQLLGMYLGSYVFTMMAIDRYNALCRPLTDRAWTSHQ